MKIAILSILSFCVLGIQGVIAEIPIMAKSKLKNSAGEVVGVATFLESNDGVNIAVQVRSLTPGLHGIHIHETGKCKSPDFKSAGGHFNPFAVSHGLRNPKGYHVGDLGNILIKEDGTGTMLTLSSLATLQGSKNSLFRKGGTALVIHSGPDDLISDPTGNAGSRVACGVIKMIK